MITKTLLAPARFLDGPRETKRAVSLAQMLTSVLAAGVDPTRRARLERVRSLVVARGAARYADPSDIVRRAFSLVAHDARQKSVPLVVRCACRSLPVRDTFSEALSCLIDNAIRANRSGELVLVDVSESGSQHALLQIHDVGDGIAPDVLAHLGDPCRATVDGALGVAMANAIIQEHDGTLHFESRARVGTTTSVLVPTTSEKHGGRDDDRSNSAA